MKNTTPNQLAYLTALANGFLCLMFMSISFLLFKSYLSHFSFILLFVVINTLVCYGLFYVALERFIYRKIKLVYKNIHRLKRPDANTLEKISMNQNIMDNVEAEVMEWAKEKKGEIDELKKMEKFRRDFLGNVSHELKTPLFSIQGLLDTLIDGGLQDQNINMEYLIRANKNVDRLISIVEDLSTISHHESGELEIKWTTFNIYDLCKEVMDSLEIMADANDTTLTFKEGANKSINVTADRDKIGQVIDNLLTNAIKYGKINGSAIISIYDMAQTVLVEITDNGIGIPEEHLPRLFERFYRIDSSRVRNKGGGSGLGLAIVKHIMEAHNQTIHVRSKVGIGTTFGFTVEKAK